MILCAIIKLFSDIGRGFVPRPLTLGHRSSAAILELLMSHDLRWTKWRTSTRRSIRLTENMAAAKNKYQALASERDKNAVEDVDIVENDISSKIDDVVKAALANLKTSQEVKISDGRGKRSGRGGNTLNIAIIGEIVAAVVKSVCPLIIEAVDTAAKNIVNLNVGVKAKEVDRQSLLHRYETDRLEQYTRRDNVRIFGLEEGDNENDIDLEGKLISLAEGMGVELTSGEERFQWARGSRTSVGNNEVS